MSLKCAQSKARARFRAQNSLASSLSRRLRHRGVRSQAAPPALESALSHSQEGDVFDSIEDGIAAITRGEFIIVLDDQNRENEGDLIIAADKVTPEKIAYMVEYTSGVICVAISEAESQRLQLPLMVKSEENQESMYTAFTVTTDLRQGTTTGISASDRCKTIQALADPKTNPQELRRPGHIFPLIARDGGVLSRPGHTEAAIDFARLAGCEPAGVLCEVVDKTTGDMATRDYLLDMAKQHGLKCVTIEDLINYRLENTSSL